MVPVKEQFKGTCTLELHLLSLEVGWEKARKGGSPPPTDLGVTLAPLLEGHPPSGALSPGVAGRGSNAHSKGANTKIDRQANIKQDTSKRKRATG